MNISMVIGNLGRDPELSHTKDGRPMVRFAVACNERRQGEESTMWVNCLVFGKSAENFARICSKGSQVAAVGRAVSDEYTARDGTQVRGFTVMVSEWEHHGRREKRQDQGHAAQPAPPRPSFEQPDDFDDQLPF